MSYAHEEETGIRRGLGCIPQEPDDRDHKYRLDYAHSQVGFPKQYDPTGIYLTDQPNKWEATEIYDQKSIGSCTANAVMAAVEFLDDRNHYKWPYKPSRLFQYYNTRRIEGTTDEDAGATIRNAIKSVAKYGACPEDHPIDDWNWAYEDDGETFRKKPPEQCYKNAVIHTALEYKAVPQDESTVKHLLSVDLPIPFGFAVKNSFMSAQMAKTGVMKKPSWIEQTVGGHAVLAVGYLTNYKAGTQGITDWVIVRNSWGLWGNKGYFLFPLECFLNPAFASDFWIISKVGYKKPAA